MYFGPDGWEVGYGCLLRLFRLARGLAENTRKLSATLLTTQENMDHVRRTLARLARQQRSQGGGAPAVAATPSTQAMKVLELRVEEDENRLLDESDVGGLADDGAVAPYPPSGVVAR